MTPVRIQYRTCRRGFTLLEMIVAVGIMMLVAATAGEAIIAAFKIKASAEGAVDATRDTEVVGDIFVHEIRNAMPPNPLAMPDPNAADGSVSTTVLPYFLAGSFYGDDSTVTFYTSGRDPKSQPQGDVRYIEFGLSTDKYGNVVFVRRQKVNLLEDQVTDPTEEILVSNVVSVQFSYFYWDGTQTQQQPLWDSTTMGNVLPSAVQMILTLQPLAPGQPLRTITRFASIPCAAPTTQPATSSTTLGGAL